MLSYLLFDVYVHYSINYYFIVLFVFFRHHHHNLQSQYQVPYASQHSYTQKSSSYPNMQNNQPAGKHRHSVGSVNLKNNSQTVGVPIIVRHKGDGQTVARLNPTNNQFRVRFQDTDTDDKSKKQKSLDIESSLESLCLQMMEHALGP